MSIITIRFLKAALAYFVLGALLGVDMVVVPDHAGRYIPVHVHFLLLGWMSMMIYGIGYHILPRFSGKPLYSDRLSNVQFWLSNIGLIGMALSWTLGNGSTSPLALFSSLEFLSIVFFVYNIWRTLP